MALDSGFNLEFKHGGSSWSLTSFSRSNLQYPVYAPQGGSSLVGPISEMGRRASGWIHGEVTDRRFLVGKSGSGVGQNGTVVPPWLLCSSPDSCMDIGTLKMAGVTFFLQGL